MGFRNTTPVIARLLKLVSSTGQKIVAGVIAGVPRLDFYTGLTDETAPGQIAVDTGIDGGILVQAPELNGSAPPYLRLWSGPGNTKGIELYGGFNNTFEFVTDNAPNDRVTLRVINGSLNIAAESIQLGTGRDLLGISGGRAEANTSGGDGILNFDHDLETANVRITATRVGAANQVLTRFEADDTALTFRCKVRNLDGTIPPNGTLIVCQWVGVALP